MLETANPNFVDVSQRMAEDAQVPTTASVVAPAIDRRRPYATLDAWRGVAALMVVCYHASVVVVHKRLSGQSRPIYKACEMGWLGVELFFVISGYCIAAAADSSLARAGRPSSFLRARGRRIYPAYWASLAMGATVAAITSLLLARGYLSASTTAQAANLHHGVGYWLTNLSLLQGFAGNGSYNVVSWTLCYEISFYLIVGLCLFARPLLQKPSFVFDGLHLLTIGAMAMLMFMPQKTPFPLDLWPLFGMGVLAFDLTRRQISGKAIAFAAVIFFQCAWLVVTRNDSIGLMPQSIRLAYSTGGCFAAIIVVLYPFDAKLSAAHILTPLRVIGVGSYSLYLIHFYVLGAVNQAFNLFSRRPSMHWVQFWVSIIASLGVAGVFFLVFERPFLSRKARKRIESVAEEKAAA
jgi:exopolysaccharide production protein ExoZ